MKRRSLDFDHGYAGGLRYPTRRDLLSTLPMAGLAAFLGPVVARADDGVAEVVSVGAIPDSFPRQSEELVLEVVRVSHFDLDRVSELVESRPALARASWDWGFGDWETALGAASHTGRREIAEVLMAHGARPTLFTAAMMGWLEVVQTTVAARPGIQRELGPHGITLLSHARAGGEAAAAVAAWLAKLGDADPQPALFDGDPEIFLGVYRFGEGETEVLEVLLDRRQNLSIQRPGQVSRNLMTVGEQSFYPSGVPSVRIRFEVDDGAARAMVVQDGSMRVRALRRAID